MVEICNKRFEQLLEIETRFNLMKEVYPKIPNYLRGEVLEALLNLEMEETADAE